MQASFMSAPDVVEIREVPIPTPRQGELLVRMRYAGICGSDLKRVHYAMTEFAEPQDTVGSSGHECIGEVVEVRGPAAVPTDAFQVGDLVLALPPEENGFAEYLALPMERCLRLPDGLSPLQAVRSQQLGTVIHSLRAVGALMDQKVVIVGQGAAGLEFSLLALAAGARQVVAVEPRPARRAAAQRLGVDAVFDPGEPDCVAAVTEATRGGADLVLEAVGTSPAIDLSYQVVQPMGGVLQFGVPRGVTTFNHDLAFRKQVTTYRAVYAQAEPNLACFRLALTLLLRGTLTFAGHISHQFPFPRLAEAIAFAGNPAGDALKVVLDFAPARATEQPAVATPGVRA